MRLPDDHMNSISLVRFVTLPEKVAVPASQARIPA